MGKKVEVKLYQATDGAKLWVGALENYADGAVTVGGHTFSKGQVASVRLRMASGKERPFSSRVLSKPVSFLTL